MRNKINTIIAVSVLVFIAMACNASFTTANISSFNFGKNNSANPPTTTFEAGEKVFAVAVVSNTSSKHKMRFKFENVSGNDVPPLTKELDFEGARPVFLELTIPAGGEYKVEAALFDEQGKELDKKSGTFTVKGKPRTDTEEPKKSSSTESNSDSEDN